MIVSLQEPDIEYPETDGQPMGDNTLQIKWMIVLFNGLDTLYMDDPNIFTACNLMWYPVQGNNKIVTAPDVMVVFGRPKGYRPSYKQWEEGGVPPTVGFEVLSENNTKTEMKNKLAFNEKHGMDEYYVYDPYEVGMLGYQRKGKKLVPIRELNGWVSPRLNVRFDLSGEELVVWQPNGQRFLTHSELQRASQEAFQRADELKKLAAKEKKDAERESQKLAALIQKLKSHGIDPDKL